MSTGTACRVSINDLADFSQRISALNPNEAITLGRLQDDLPKHVEIISKAKRADLNGHAPRGVISRSGDHIIYRPGEPALALIDYDIKGMPERVRVTIERAGGFWAALTQVLPELGMIHRVERSSTNSGITVLIPESSSPSRAACTSIFWSRTAQTSSGFCMCSICGLGWLDMAG
jgi:hypothetical protein